MSELSFFAFSMSIVFISVILFFIIVILDNIDERIAKCIVFVFILIAFLLIISSVYWLPRCFGLVDY